MPWPEVPPTTHGPPEKEEEGDLSQPAKTPELHAPEVVRPPPVDHAPAANDLGPYELGESHHGTEDLPSTQEAYDPWTPPGGFLLSSSVSFEKSVAGMKRAREVYRESLTRQRLARGWWKAKLGKREFTRQRRRGELLNVTLDNWWHYWQESPAAREAWFQRHQRSVLAQRALEQEFRTRLGPSHSARDVRKAMRRERWAQLHQATSSRQVERAELGDDQ